MVAGAGFALQTYHDLFIALAIHDFMILSYTVFAADRQDTDNLWQCTVRESLQ